MVIYGYGIDINEADRLEENDFRRKWQAEKRRVAASTPLAIQNKLLMLYTSLHEDKAFDKYDFVDAIAWRVYTEGCMNHEIADPDHYQSEALTTFIDREIYFACERASLKRVYYNSEEIRDLVMEGLVERANDLFSDWNGSAPFNPDDKRNLRDDLRSYIGF